MEERSVCFRDFKTGELLYEMEVFSVFIYPLKSFSVTLLADFVTVPVAVAGNVALLLLFKYFCKLTLVCFLGDENNFDASP